MSQVNFFTEEIAFKLSHPKKTSSWIKKAIAAERKDLRSLNFVFCTDEYLGAINKQYLKHQTFTDVITFDQSDDDALEGDIFISVERIRENAQKFSNSFDDELHRVLIHGVLHLIGYGDKTKAHKIIMRKKEDAYLSLR